MMKRLHVGARARRSLLVAGIVVIVLVLFGFFGLPPIVRSQAEKRLSAELNRPVSIEKVRINPLVLAVTIEGFAIADRDGGPFVSWRRFHANFDSFSLFTGDWRFSEIALQGFRGHVAIDNEGRLNFADLLERPAPPEEEEDDDEPRPLFIRQLVVDDAQVNFSDQSRSAPFESQLGPLEFTLDDFRTAGGDAAPYAFQAQTEAGEALTWQGTISMEPLGSSGAFQLRNITLPKYAPYYEDFVEFDLLEGTLDLGGQYSVSLASGQPALQLQEGSVSVRDLRIALPDTQEPLVQLASFDVNGIDAELTDPANPTAQVAKVAVQGLNVRALRDNDGINLLRMLPASEGEMPDADSASATSTAATETPEFPAVRVSEIDLIGARIEWQDSTLPEPAQAVIEDLTVQVRDLDLGTPETRTPVNVSARLASGGDVRLEGGVSLAPLAATLTTQVNDLALAAGTPYTEALATVRLVDGLLTVSGDAELIEGVARFSGDVAIRQLRTESIAGDPLGGWDALEISGAQVTATPMSAKVETVRLVKPVAHVQIDSEGRLNVSQIGGGADADEPARDQPDPAAPDAATTEQPERTLPDVEVARIELADAALHFEDRSITPAVQMEVEAFGGTITGLSSQAGSRAEVDLRGQATGGAAIRITGQLNPLSQPPFADVTVDFQNLDLSPAGPYVAKYAGHRLNGGTLTLDVDADLSDWQLNSRNVVTLEQFTLGEKTNSPDATTLPVQLGLALLRDRSGRIVLEIPVQGKVNDPSFSVAPVVTRVITNLLTKAATSPFALLGSMFGGGGEELSFQVFQPGQSESAPDQRQKLETVARALQERPALKLEIRGSFDPAADREALQRDRLEQELAAAAGVTVEPGAPAEPLDPARRLEVLSAKFREAFPAAATAVVTEDGSSTTDSESIDATNESTDDPTLRRRFTRWMRRVFGRPTDASAESATSSAPATAPSGPSTPDAPAAPDGAMQPQPTPEEMFRRLAERITVTPEDLQQLAHARANWVRTILVDTGGIQPERITVADPASEGARVNLGLK